MNEYYSTEEQDPFLDNDSKQEGKKVKSRTRRRSSNGEMEEDRLLETSNEEDEPLQEVSAPLLLTLYMYMFIVCIHLYMCMHLY